MDDALQDLWFAVNHQIPFDPDAGLVKYWKQHWKDLGSPVGPEHGGNDGNVYQAFTRGMLRWTSNGAEQL